MATEAILLNYTRKAASDLSASQYCFVKQAATGRVSVCSSSGENAFGVLQDTPTAIDRAANVCVLGVTKVVAGATVAIGSLVQTDASGRAIDVAGGVVLGEAVSGGGVGEVISILLRPRTSAGYVFSTNATDIQTATVTIAAADLKTMNATPVSVIASPGLGYANVLESAVLFMDYASVAYTGVGSGDDITLRYTNSSGATIATVETVGFLDQASDQVRFVRPTTTAEITPVANAAIVAHISTGEIYTNAGDSPLKLKLYYRVIPTAF